MHKHFLLYIRRTFLAHCHSLGPTEVVKGRAQSYKHTDWYLLACDQLLISFLLPGFPHLFLPDLFRFPLSPPLALPLNSPVIGFYTVP